MRTRRIHVFGASGAGVTTLGRALANSLAIPHHDTDDYFWLPTSPPYRRQRDIRDRLRLMQEMFLARDAWVLSGSLEGWGVSLSAAFDLVAFLYVPTEIRMRRLRDRETRRFGRDVVAPGGWRHQETEDFLEWASHYDDGTREGRSLRRHLAWLETLSCPLLRLDGELPTAELVDQVVKSLDV